MAAARESAATFGVDAGSVAPRTRAQSEIRLVGRGGQGVVTAGDLVGKAAVLEGRFAQSIPTFGPERRGALSLATLRIADDEILLKCSSSAPDVVLVLDPTIWQFANPLVGLKEGAVLVFNTPRPPAEIRSDLRSGQFGYRLSTDRSTLYTVDATGIALELLGRAITNTAMMGALVGATGVLRMESIEAVLEDRFGAKAKANIDAARAARAQLTRLEN